MTQVAQSNNQIANNKATPADRFTMEVIRQFPNPGGEPVELTRRQKNLINNYFVKIDSVLKESEIKRYAPKNDLEFSWANVNVHKLAQDVVAFSNIGLDPLQKNQINPIPYKNSKTNKYDITFIEGFNGLELKARKYGYEVPDDVIFELKYSTDQFKSYKKNMNNSVESYDFEITNDFDRGELEGGFYYMIYRNNPEKNKLVVMNRRQIEKRRPEYAAAEFWGGEKDEWKNGQRTGQKVKVEGWEEEMFMKTLKRHCWDSINIDSEKIDDHLMRLIETESQSNDRAILEDINANANKKEMGFDDVEDAEEVREQAPPELPQGNKQTVEMPDEFETASSPQNQANQSNQSKMTGPGF